MNNKKHTIKDSNSACYAAEDFRSGVCNGRQEDDGLDYGICTVCGKVLPVVEERHSDTDIPLGKFTLASHRCPKHMPHFCPGGLSTYLPEDWTPVTLEEGIEAIKAKIDECKMELRFYNDEDIISPKEDVWEKTLRDLLNNLSYLLYIYYYENTSQTL